MGEEKIERLHRENDGKLDLESKHPPVLTEPRFLLDVHGMENELEEERRRREFAEEELGRLSDEIMRNEGNDENLDLELSVLTELEGLPPSPKRLHCKWQRRRIPSASS